MIYKKKLIEVALPLEDINREAARENYIYKGNPSGIHKWWAQRPLAACRAMVFASIVDDPSEHVPELLADTGKRAAAEKELKARKKAWAGLKATFDKASSAGMKSVADPGALPEIEEIIEEQERERLFNIIRELVKWENSNNDRVMTLARAEILRSTDGNPPPVCDPFCGGGSIPLEAQRLGLEAHASDLNPVPVLITKALIEIPPKFAGKAPVNPEAKEKLSASGSWRGAAGLGEDIRYYGQWMRDEAEKRVGHLYPKVKLPKEQGGGEATVIAWLWARTVASPNPVAKGAHVPLMRSFWLSTKPGKKTWLEPVIEKGGLTYRFEVRTGKGEPRAGTVGRGADVCLLTNAPMTRDYIRAEAKAGRMGVRLMAIVADGPNGRTYVSPNAEHEVLAVNTKGPVDAPESEIVGDLRYLTPVTYGMTKHRDLFTPRQLTTLSTLSSLVSKVRDKVLADSGGNEVCADAVATYLAFGINKYAIYGNALATWYTKEDRTSMLFGRQAIPMVWDFCEVNPLTEIGGSITKSLSIVADVIDNLPVNVRPGQVVARSATEIPDTPKVVFSTDPPYYDNVPYADLSDFFYVWLRRVLVGIYPSELSTMLVPKAEELVADPFRQGGREAAREFFEKGMGRVFGRMREASDDRFPTTIYYAFKQAEQDEADADADDNATSRTSTGWETFLQGLIDTNWQVDGTWPLRTERTGRLRDNASNALASSIVLVCRPRPKDAGVASRRDFLVAMKRELPEALRNLQKGNIAPVDLAQAAIGPGMAVFSRYARVLEADGSPMSVRTALSLINQSLDEVLAEQEGEFDADTRWALAWFDQNGFNEGAYGVAETLCTAKNTSVSGMVEAGILAAKGGKVRLLKKEELPADWDPTADSRLTVWEATHHLIRSLDSGEQAAAALLKKLGAMAEVARDLSYRLYTVCERRKWAHEAIGYNALVLSWPDVKRQADEQKDLGPAQRDLI
jgi:putative DNA methylase